MKKVKGVIIMIEPQNEVEPNRPDQAQQIRDFVASRQRIAVSTALETLFKVSELYTKNIKGCGL